MNKDEIVIQIIEYCERRGLKFSREEFGGIVNDISNIIDKGNE